MPVNSTITTAYTLKTAIVSQLLWSKPSSNSSSGTMLSDILDLTLSNTAHAANGSSNGPRNPTVWEVRPALTAFSLKWAILRKHGLAESSYLWRIISLTLLMPLNLLQLVRWPNLLSKYWM